MHYPLSTADKYFQAPEPEAVNTVLQYYGRRIRYASRISGQADKEAEDFITETLLKALFKFRFSRVSPPDTTE